MRRNTATNKNELNLAMVIFLSSKLKPLPRVKANNLPLPLPHHVRGAQRVKLRVLRKTEIPLLRFGKNSNLNDLKPHDRYCATRKSATRFNKGCPRFGKHHAQSLNKSLLSINSTRKSQKTVPRGTKKRTRERRSGKTVFIFIRVRPFGWFCRVCKAVNSLKHLIN